MKVGGGASEGRRVFVWLCVFAQQMFPAVDDFTSVYFFLQEKVNKEINNIEKKTGLKTRPCGTPYVSASIRNLTRRRKTSRISLKKK